MIPDVCAPDVYEVTLALELIRRNAEMPAGELRLLIYLVEETLAGRGGHLHQKTIAADVFGRDISTFDPRAFSIVRTTAANLRESLTEYYASRGQSDQSRWQIDRFRLTFSKNGRSEVFLAAPLRL